MTGVDEAVVRCRKLFPKMSRVKRKEYIAIEREAREKLKEFSRNQTFALGIPRKLRNRMREPESMTIRKAKRNYLQPSPLMEEPKLSRIYRGRGRSLRIQRDAEDSFRF